MRFSDRFRRLLKGFPPGASVTLPVDVLRRWLDESGPGPFEPDMTVQEVAEKVGRSPVTVRAWIRQGQLRAYKFQNREWRITPENLGEFNRDQRATGSPEKLEVLKAG